MKSKDIFQHYDEDINLLQLSEWAKKTLANTDDRLLEMRGLAKGQDAVVLAWLANRLKSSHLVVLEDREEAAYFANDLQSLLPDREIRFFPTSYKKPYEVVKTENANVLQRAEVLNNIYTDNEQKGAVIVSYPDALSEKVINQMALTNNTLTLKNGEVIGRDSIGEILIDFGFERSEFVYEAGQFSIRGDIVDIYSFAAELPYRLELFGDEIESIRRFDPESQLSEDHVERINIIPNVQTRLLKEGRVSFLDFIPKETLIWNKNTKLTMEVVAKYYETVERNFEEIKAGSGNPDMLSQPAQLWDDLKEFERQMGLKKQIEFGTQFTFKKAKTLQFNASPQMSFNKDFNLLAEKLQELNTQEYKCYICSESPSQLDRLENILEEHQAPNQFEPLHFALRQGYVDLINHVAIFTDHQIFERYHKYKSRKRHSKSKALTLKEVQTLQPGDFVTHVDYGIGKFAGLGKIKVVDKTQEAVRIIYRDNDVVTVSMHNLHKISKFSGKENTPPRLSKLGSPEWENKKRKVKSKIKDIAEDLIKLYAKRRNSPGTGFTKDSYLQHELESSFIYEDTPDQGKATQAVKEDMEKTYPMDRLVCGDVGFGKTEIAIRAAFKAATDGKQVAVLVPTTILATQHQKTFKGRLEGMGVEVDHINRFRSTKEKNEIFERLANGKIDILIGTHAIVGKKVKFKDLGLLIIDEEQKFGVAVKEKLKNIKVNVDTLTLTATPIPRTLQFSLMGARDLSIIATPPPNRQPVTTEIHNFTEEFIRDAVSFEIGRNGQVFFIHNRVKEVEQIADIILRLVPDATVGVAHGQMDSKKLEDTMMKFIEGEYDVLVSTNIVESGLDIPNANTIIINHAHMFGLSDLHQMRGRVGRSNRKAFCYLLIPSMASMHAESKRRLQALEEYSELGDGFKVAMRDLDIRGAGNLLGGEQSGFINDIGFDMYHKILDDAVQDLKQNDFKDLFKDDIEKAGRLIRQECQVETDMEILIPEDYIGSISERLELYTQLDNIKDEEGLAKFENNMVDRFGKMPKSVRLLVKSVRMRWMAEDLGFEKVLLKGGRMKCYVKVEGNDDYFQGPVFGSILKYAQLNPKSCSMREVKSKMLLTLKDINDIEVAINTLNSIKELQQIEP